MHKEPLQSNPRTSVVTRNNINTRNSEKTCVFYFQPRGCKKGTNCDFSHDSSRRQPNIAKIRKICYNGPTCKWKPSCKYVHQEDGETIPARALRERGRSFQPQPNSEVFVYPDVSQPPPGLSSMTEFPGLPQLGRPSVFRQNPQFQ